MKTFLIFISILGLGLTIIPSVFVFTKTIPMGLNQHLMFAGMLMWFFTAPFWMEEQDI